MVSSSIPWAGSTLSWANKGNAEAADSAPGQGLTTGTRTVPGSVDADANNIGGYQVAPGLAGTSMGHPVTWWVAILVILIGIKFAAEKGGEGSDFSNIKVGFWNLFVITFSAIVGLVFTKWVFAKYYVPGLSDVVLAS